MWKEKGKTVKWGRKNILPQKKMSSRPEDGRKASEKILSTASANGPKSSAKRENRIVGKTILAAATVFGILLLTGLLMEATAPETLTASKTAAATSTVAETVYGAGEPVIAGNLAYTVEKVYTADRIAFAKADGVYVIVSLTIENVGKETVTVDSEMLKIEDEQGRTYSANDDATVFLDRGLIVRQFQPNIPSRADIAFDVPKNIGRISLRVYSDKNSKEYKLIDLGTAAD
ncbi:MAG: DUF4352 domain-containing protein [Nitrososphaeria archaeon]|uniref:DUF4352 domain-containing protein n=1 Tax=Thermofilum sp. TaxID=1961369 RepID=UPI003181B6EF